MLRCRLCAQVLGAALVLAVLGPATGAADKDKDTPKKNKTVAGIVTMKDNKSITVKVDGEEEPTRFDFPDDAEKKLGKVYRTTFTVGRVKLTYKTDGDRREVVSMEKQPGLPAGTITGTVVKVYDNFWVEVKPKTGVAEGFALQFPIDKNKEETQKLMKDLEPGDTVTIRYTTDNERHRIQSMQRVGKAKK